MSDIGLESVLRRDRLVTAVALAVIVILAWAYVIWFASSMSMPMPPAAPAASTDTGMSMDMDMPMKMDMPGMDMGTPSPDVVGTPAIAPWSVPEFAFVASMWIAMMVGMMTPSAAPMILLYARVGRSAAAQGKPFASAAWFAGGYLLVWAIFAVAATGAQWLLEQALLISPMMGPASRLVGGIILVVAGLYQLTPLKDACLGQCRAPLSFIQQHGGFQRTAAGSLRLGVQHGLYCIGCCWALMALLFVGGVMNPLWIAGIVVLVLVEKLVPAARWVPRAAGVALALSGIWLLATP
jgi:predicted metal-binding membrane protein